MKLTFFIALLFSGLTGAFAMAEEGEIPTTGTREEPRIVYKQRTTVSFDDAVVEGTTNNPEGVYVVTPPAKQFGSLLKLRPNFHRELVRDALLLK
jgi:hypothetical protein